jgi:hypothetical protein
VNIVEVLCIHVESGTMRPVEIVLGRGREWEDEGGQKR